jgi:hypothetical protein
MKVEREHTEDRTLPVSTDTPGKPQRKPRTPVTAWGEYAHALLMTNEAAFVD